MNHYAPIRNINNSKLNTIHASPLHTNDQSIERYEYQRKTPMLGVDTNTTNLKKKFYGNSSNKSASYIAEKKRVNQIGLYSNTLPVKEVANNYCIPAQNSALRRVRSSGYVLPKKCINKTTTSITPLFNGRSIALNPDSEGGHKWYNLTHNRWAKFCVNDVLIKKNLVSGYYSDYLKGSLGTSKIINTDNNVVQHMTENVGFAKTYTNIHNRYVPQPYNPSGF
jgi:hypothetical protein